MMNIISDSSLLSILVAEDKAIQKEKFYGEMIEEWKNLQRETDNSILKEYYGEHIAECTASRDDAIDAILSARDKIRKYFK